jgi:predicted metal-dependent peptidase
MTSEIQRLEREKRENRRQLDRLRFHGGQTAATSNAIDRRQRRDLELQRKLAKAEEDWQAGLLK